MLTKQEALDSKPALRLDSLLRREGLTGRWLAGEVGVSEAYISHIRKGLRPRRGLREAIATALSERLGRQVTVEELWP